MNTLYYGDCLTVMQNMKAGSVDLIYLDPPFNSKKNYHSIYKDETGRPLPDQIEAFCDMWTLTEEREREIRNMPVLVRETGISDDVAEFWRVWMGALRKTNPALLAYLSYMTIRLAHMRVLLRSTGSLFLHCDPTASHYIKVLLDGVFGQKHFQNEIVWCYTGPTTGAVRHFPRKHDTLLWYSKGDVWTFNADAVRIPYSPETLARRGRVEGTKSITSASAPAAKRDEQAVEDTYGAGKAPEDWWNDIPALTNQRERMGYATQKPLKLMKRIILSSTNDGDTVMDPFCGCATTLEAAHALGRRWVGIDIAIHAVKRVARIRLTDRCGLVEGTDYEIHGVPRDVEGARDLWKRDKYHFQKWAVER